MRVLLNTLLMHGSRSGVGHYTAELLRGLRERASSDEQIVARPGPWVRWFRRCRKGSAAGSRPGLKHWLRQRCKPLGRSLFRAYLRLACWTGRCDLYHEPNYIPARVNVPTLATVHDLSLLRPEWQPAERVAWFEKNIPALLQPNVHLLTDSQAVRKEIIARLGVPASRVTAIPLGVRACFRPLPESEYRPVLQRLGLPSRYLLYVGTIEPRKNVLTLLQAYCDLPALVREKSPLILAGGWGWKAGETAAYYETTARHGGVMHLGYVPEEALAALYNGARALVFPSFYEGFGLPPLEMLACGGAVLAANAAAVAEVVGGQARLLEAEDVPAWRAALAEILTDDEALVRLRSGAVEHANSYTWERCADETLGVYRDILAPPRVLQLSEAVKRRAAG